MSKKTLVKIALGQFESIQGNTAANLNKMTEMINRAASENADLIVFPELAYTGYFVNHWKCSNWQSHRMVRLYKHFAESQKKRKFILLLGTLNPVKFQDEFIIRLFLLMIMVL